MPMPADRDAIARQIKSAQDEVRQIATFTAQYPDLDVAAAYAVADRVHHARLQEGAVPVGRKIGFTNSGIWDEYGVYEPIWGYVYEHTAVQLADELADGPHVCELAKLTEPRIEPEIVFHFHSAPPAGGGLAEILACVDWVAHGFEIVQSHYPDWKFKVADTIADDGLHGTMLVGAHRPVGALGPALIAALERFTVTLSCNGERRETGRGSNVLGSPLAAVAHLIAVLAKQPDYPPLQAGELVTTGTLTRALPVHAGERWQTDLQGIDVPGLDVRFA